MNLDVLMYTALGYLCGSILFFRLYIRLFAHKDLAAQAADHNPGVFNAFKFGGLPAGLFVLTGDLAKGIAPVWLYLRQCPDPELPLGFALVLAAPVFGHIYSIFNGFHGGKGIATTFGVLIGVWAGGVSFWPLGTLACLFLFFKLIFRISSDFYMTVIVYLLLPVLVWLEPVALAIDYGLLLISTGALIRLALSTETKARLEVKPFWKH